MIWSDLLGDWTNYALVALGLCIGLAIKRIDGRRETAQWRSIETALNEAGKLKFLLVQTREFNTPSVAALTENGKWVTPDDYFALVGTPTHWMPLPEPPR